MCEFCAVHRLPNCASRLPNVRAEPKTFFPKTSEHRLGPTGTSHSLPCRHTPQCRHTARTGHSLRTMQQSSRTMQLEMPDRPPRLHKDATAEEKEAREKIMKLLGAEDRACTQSSCDCTGCCPERVAASRVHVSKDFAQKGVTMERPKQAA